MDKIQGFYKLNWYLYFTNHIFLQTLKKEL